MKRDEILNNFIQERGYTTYLEIGIHDTKNNFDKILCTTKIGVDPDINAHATYVMTSDEFFKHNEMKFDIIFIDGLHEAHQVYKDIQNSLKVLQPSGIIMLHDCNPISMQGAKDYEDFPLEDYGKYSWNGDCWKALVKYRFESDYLVYTLNHDEGCGIIDTRHGSEVDKRHKYSIGEMTYSMLEKDRNYLLGLR